MKRHDSDRQPHRDAATTVRLGNNSTAFVDNSVGWRIQPAVGELFLDYRDFDNVRDNLVTRELGPP